MHFHPDGTAGGGRGSLGGGVRVLNNGKVKPSSFAGLRKQIPLIPTTCGAHGDKVSIAMILTPCARPAALCFSAGH